MKSCSVFTGNASKLNRRLHKNYARGRAGMMTLDQLNVMRQYLDALRKLFPDNAVFAFTDGSSFPDDGLGGAGVYLVGPSPEQVGRMAAFSSGIQAPVGRTTNNAAELQAIGWAIDEACDCFEKTLPLVILTDSDFVYGALCDDTAIEPGNRSFVEAMKVKIDMVRKERKLHIYKLPGHAAIPGNDNADLAAKRAAKLQHPFRLRCYETVMVELMVPKTLRRPKAKVNTNFSLEHPSHGDP